jgi:hypothetical protein
MCKLMGAIGEMNLTQRSYPLCNLSRRMAPRTVRDTQVSEDFQFQTRINPSWLAAVRVASPRLRIATPFPLMNIVAREKGVTASIEGQVLVLTVGPGDPPPAWPSRQFDLLVILQRCTDAMSMLEAIRAARPAVKPPAAERPSPKAPKRTRTASSPKSSARSSKVPPVVSMPISHMLSTARPEEVWGAIRERQGEPFTVDELQATLGAGVGPYVMIWARNGFLIKADRDSSPDAPWRYRLLRDAPEHPPVG